MFKRPPSQLDQFLDNPSLYLAKHVYGRHKPDSTPAPSLCHPPDPRPVSNTFSASATAPVPVTVVCISDTHNQTPGLPLGDILIHAGDLTVLGSARELQAELDWLAAQPHQHKIVIAGNHDQILDPRRDPTPDDADSKASKERSHLRWHDVIYLENTSATLSVRQRTFTIFGSPLTPKNGNWAFQYPRDDAAQVWHGRVPDGTDILVTHCPPRGHADMAAMAAIGCTGLLREMWRVRPALSVFGHVHAGRGVEILEYDGVQARWEEIVESKGGWRALRRLVAEVLWAFMALVLGMLRIGMGGRRERAEKTLVVNAAHMGGMRDELRRAAIVVAV